MSKTLDAGEDRLIVDAFDRACAAYPRAYGGDAIVDGVAAGSDDSDDALLGGAAPAEPHAAALAMPPRFRSARAQAPTLPPRSTAFFVLLSAKAEAC